MAALTSTAHLFFVSVVVYLPALALQLVRGWSGGGSQYGGASGASQDSQFTPGSLNSRDDRVSQDGQGIQEVQGSKILASV